MESADFLIAILTRLAIRISLGQYKNCFRHSLCSCLTQLLYGTRIDRREHIVYHWKDLRDCRLRIGPFRLPLTGLALSAANPLARIPDYPDHYVNESTD